MFYDKLAKIISEKAGTLNKGKVASERTYSARKESLLSSFRQLHRLGYKLQEPSNLNEKHIKALMEHWLFTKKSKPKTIEANLSNLRIFAKWIGKEGMVKMKLDYLPKEQHHLLKVETAARASKSPSGKNIDIQEIFERADKANFRLGLMLRMEVGFGLRREEVLKCRPHIQDFEDYLQIEKGHGKGGRERKIRTLTSAQRALIDLVKQHIEPQEAMGWPLTKDGKCRASLEQNETRYKNYMSKIGMTKKDLGVTGHSLRAQFAENNALANGIIPPSMGGSQGQKSKFELRPILLRLSEAMGHNRTKVMSAYYCSFGKRVVLDAETCLQDIEAALESIQNSSLMAVDEQNWDDCTYIRELLGTVGLDINLKQTQHLWNIYSQRNGVQWVRPEHEIAICMQAAAINVNKIEACK